MKWMGGGRDGRKQNTPGFDGGIRTRPAPDYPVAGGFNITPRRDGGYF